MPQLDRCPQNKGRGKIPQLDRCPQNKAVLLKPQDVKEKKYAALFGVPRVLKKIF